MVFSYLLSKFRDAGGDSVFSWVRMILSREIKLVERWPGILRDEE